MYGPQAFCMRAFGLSVPRRCRLEACVCCWCICSGSVSPHAAAVHKYRVLSIYYVRVCVCCGPPYAVAQPNRLLLPPLHDLNTKLRMDFESRRLRLCFRVRVFSVIRRVLWFVFRFRRAAAPPSAADIVCYPSRATLCYPSRAPPYRTVPRAVFAEYVYPSCAVLLPASRPCFCISTAADRTESTPLPPSLRSRRSAYIDVLCA